MSQAEVWDGDTMTAFADGIFVQPRPELAEKYFGPRDESAPWATATATTPVLPIPRRGMAERVREPMPELPHACSGGLDRVPSLRRGVGGRPPERG